GAGNLEHLEAGPPARWRFRVHAGDGRTVSLGLWIEMPPGRNAVQLHWFRDQGTDLPGGGAVSLTLRLDLEDRGFHEETHRSGELDARFRSATSPLPDRPGFRFVPAPGRELQAWCHGAIYHPEPEWSSAAHPVEASRGLADGGDAWSPGWFDLPMVPGVGLTLSLEAGSPGPSGPPIPLAAPPPPASDSLGQQLARASEAYLARRGTGLTVIAGYPWFLDWGRDAFIAARGYLAAGRGGAVLDLLRTFGAFARKGTLPNRLAAGDVGDRDTSDAPLWFALALEEAAAVLGPQAYDADAGGRPLGEVLRDLALDHLRGAMNGVRVDPASALIWSPAHFTWMDTNHPAGTPREGYPIELQALWIRMLRQLARLQASPAQEPWDTLALRAEAALERFWLPGAGWYADVLAGPAGVPASQARPLDHLRPNQLFLVSLGLLQGPRARRVVAAAQHYLLIPGALRSLAPLPVTSPLEVRDSAGRLLNDPRCPYWGRYEGDEDTRRKPAYHNGTGWVWLLPTFCEALAAAWDHAPEAVAAARALLGTLEGALAEGCVGHLPELLDGDAPHAQRGCDAQAWSVTEALRVWIRLGADAGPGRA
ncbi:MAG TPA: amylo-alpha-1,6-glucosidase, partial [Holophagaceae bacterium]